MPPGDETKTGEENTGIKPEVPAQPVQPEQPVRPKTEEINVSNLTQENPNTIEVDWGAAEKGQENAFFKGPTKPVAEVKPLGNSGGPSATATPSGPSFEIGIKVLIAIIDFIMSNVLCKIAGDTSAHAYTADKGSKDNLKDALMMIMEENKIKLPAWVVVLFAFLAAYGFQIMAAIDARKEKNKQKKNPDTFTTPSAKEALQPGVFEKDGKLWRRYANGAVHERKFNLDGTEKIIGKPSRRMLSEAA